MRSVITLLLLVTFANSQNFILGDVALGAKKPELRDFASTTNFAFKLYKQIAASTDKSKNIIFSPLSVYVALGMLKAGTKGRTEIEMEKYMEWQQLIESSKSSNGHSAIQKLLADVFSPLSKNNTVNVANKLWLQKYFCSSLCNDYIAKLQRWYKAELGQLNFVKNPENSRRAINKWVEEKTNQKIKDLFPAGSLNALTRFVITNAIYFKGKWKYQFDKKNTAPLSFSTLKNGRYVVKRVDAMYRKAKVFADGFIPSSRYQTMELPYTDESLTMLIVLPSTPDHFKRFEQLPEPVAFLEELLTKLYRYPSTELDVYLPKFKVTTDLDLKESLTRMGMKDVFDPSSADLSGITGFKGMYVSNAVHKAYINVDEEGTEAAAATGIGISLTSLSFQFIVNRPFFYFIRHVPTGTILFMGRVLDPTAQ